MTTSHPICVIFDLLGPILYGLYTIFNLKIRRANISFGIAVLWGIIVGCCWEIPFGLLGDHFLVTPNNPLGFSIHIIHAIWDSILFMFGLYIFHIRKKATYTCCKKTVYLTLYGLLSEIIVEFLFNGSYWTYRTNNSYNPVLFTIHNIGYTLIPYLVWVVAPPIYLYGIYYIEKHYGKIYIGQSIHTKVQLLQLDDNPTEVFTI